MNIRYNRVIMVLTGMLGLLGSLSAMPRQNPIFGGQNRTGDTDTTVTPVHLNLLWDDRCNEFAIHQKFLSEETILLKQLLTLVTNKVIDADATAIQGLIMQLQEHVDTLQNLNKPYQEAYEFLHPSQQNGTALQQHTLQGALRNAAAQVATLQDTTAEEFGTLMHEISAKIMQAYEDVKVKLAAILTQARVRPGLVLSPEERCSLASLVTGVQAYQLKTFVQPIVPYDPQAADFAARIAALGCAGVGIIGVVFSKDTAFVQELAASCLSSVGTLAVTIGGIGLADYGLYRLCKASFDATNPKR